MSTAQKQPKHHSPVSRPSLKTVLWSVLSAFIGVWALAQLQTGIFATSAGPLMIGAFGATAVLLFGAPNSPLAQPYNVVVGHLISAFIGVTVYQFFGEASSIAMALAVALSIGTMQLTRSVHPPGGATALIAVIGSVPIHQLGYEYVVAPVGIGAVILVVAAFGTNNLVGKERWPLFWLPFSRPTAVLLKRRSQEP